MRPPLKGAWSSASRADRPTGSHTHPFPYKKGLRMLLHRGFMRCNRGQGNPVRRENDGDAVDMPRRRVFRRRIASILSVAVLTAVASTFGAVSANADASLS